MTPPSRPLSNGYSLVELLAVMAIMVMLAGLTAVSVSTVKPTALSAAGNETVAALANARQNSLSKCLSTALVFIKTGPGRYSAHALFEAHQLPDGALRWDQITAWKTLPQGIRFDPGYPAEPATVNDPAPFWTGAPLPDGFPTTINYQGRTIDTLSGAAIHVFTPNGMLSSGKLTALRLVEGLEGASDSVEYTHKKSDGSLANWYEILVLRDSGEPKVFRP